MAIAVLAIAVVPLFLIEATVPGPIPGNGIAALATNWEAFCRHHYVPLVESLTEEHYHPTTEYPILLDAELLREHMHILGATGSGKTAIGLSTRVPQLIRPDVPKQTAETASPVVR